MPKEAALKSLANQVHRDQVRIYPGKDGIKGKTYRFEAEGGRIMSVSMNCYDFTDEGKHTLEVLVEENGKTVSSLSLPIPGNLQGVAELGHGVVLGAKPWTLYRVAKPLDAEAA